MALCALITLNEQREHLSFVVGLRSEGRDAAAHVQSLEPQVDVNSSELALVYGDMTRLEESVRVAQRQLID